MLKKFLDFFSNDLAIDLGTANTLVFARDRGIIINEPSVVAIHRNSRGQTRVLAVGKEAKDMLGRTPGSIQAIRPLKDGVIADFEVTQSMLKYFIQKSSERRTFIRPRIIICIPFGITQVEKRAVKKSAQSAGAREVYLIEEPMAAALGAGLPIREPSGNMIVDIGGGTTEVGVISLGGLVEFELVRVGGDDFDSAILDYIRRAYNMDIGSRTAEIIKIRIGSALKRDEEQEDNLTIRGNDFINGMPRIITVKTNEITEAIGSQLDTIISGIKRVLRRTKPEISSDIIEKGIVLTGGGAMLSDINNLIHKIVNIPAYIAQDPLLCTIKGTGIALEALKDFKN